MRYKVTAGLPALLVLFGCVHTQPDSSAPAPTQSGAPQGPNNAQDTQKATPDRTEPHPAQPQAPATVTIQPLRGQAKDKGALTKAPLGCPQSRRKRQALVTPKFEYGARHEHRAGHDLCGPGKNEQRNDNDSTTRENTCHHFCSADRRFA